MHFFVSSARGSGKCHENVDDARQEVLEDLVSGIKDAVARRDMWDATAIAKLMVEACGLGVRPKWEDSGDYTLRFDQEHYWTIEECASYTCSDTVKRGSW